MTDAELDDAIREFADFGFGGAPFLLVAVADNGQHMSASSMTPPEQVELMRKLAEGLQGQEGGR